MSNARLIAKWVNKPERAIAGRGGRTVYELILTLIIGYMEFISWTLYAPGLQNIYVQVANQCDRPE